MEFTVQIVESLAWPLSTVWLGYLFRSDLRRLVARISNLKWKDAEAKFGQDIEEVEKESKVVFKNYNLEFTEDPERLLRIADISPRAGILEAWVEIETAAYRKGSLAGLEMKNINPFQLIEGIIESGILPTEIIGMLKDLRRIRNEAAHLPDYVVTYRDAEKYIRMTSKVIRAIA